MDPRRALWEQLQRDRLGPRRAEAERQRKTARFVAVEMQKVTGHPAWDLYVAHLHGLREEATARSTALLTKMGTTFSPPEVYGQQMVERAHLLGLVEGLAEAVEMIKKLIGTPAGSEEGNHAA